jgi:hypothetical protein
VIWLEVEVLVSGLESGAEEVGELEKMIVVDLFERV